MHGRPGAGRRPVNPNVREMGRVKHFTYAQEVNKLLLFLERKGNIWLTSFEDFTLLKNGKKSAAHIPFILLMPDFINLHNKVVGVPIENIQKKKWHKKQACLPLWKAIKQGFLGWDDFRHHFTFRRGIWPKSGLLTTLPYRSHVWKTQSLWENCK